MRAAAGHLCAPMGLCHGLLDSLSRCSTKCLTYLTAIRKDVGPEQLTANMLKKSPETTCQRQASITSTHNGYASPVAFHPILRKIYRPLRYVGFPVCCVTQADTSKSSCIISRL